MTATWVGRELGVHVEGDGVAELVGLALRRNPRRAHLLVSRVLGKHVPTDPRLVRAAGLALGARVAEVLDGRARPRVSLTAALEGVPGAAAAARNLARHAPGVRGLPGVTVLGYAETATGLGHLVAEALDADVYLHSTRRPVVGVTGAGGFAEEHSHATEHLLLPSDPGMLTGTGPLVLVDDELSTGRTVANTLRALHRLAPRPHYVVAALVDLRAPDDHAVLQQLAVELGSRVDVVALAAGTVRVPPDVLAAGAALVAAHDPVSGAANAALASPGVAKAALAAPAAAPAAPATAAADPVRVDLGWPVALPDGGRHGVLRHHRRRLEAELPAVAARLAHVLPTEGEVLVLGFEELMHAPLRLAEALADAHPALRVRSSTTTRSPVLAVDHDGYAIRHRLVFPAHDHPSDGPGERYAYNIRPGRFDAVVLVVDGPADTPELAGLLDALAGVTPSVVLAVVPSWVPALDEPAGSSTSPRGRSSVPGARSAPPGRPCVPQPLHGPEFGSYAAAEVSWLLTDLSHVELEAPTEEREEAVQSGGAHYAESLPVEYQPDPAYLELFHDTLRHSASRLAHAVGTVTEMLLAERGPHVVLASLARAGTPVGILVRRWAAHVHGLDLPHVAVSIVRGRGIDPVALSWLAERYDPASVVFLDGWTGKGAITSELTAALDAHHAATGQRFDDALAVLADPGYCVRTFGTRRDWLIPSACLNSTVSGLVSRTVLNAEHIGPGQFHGAKFYAELASSDVSNAFLDAVTAEFDTVLDDVLRDAPVLAATDRTPTWQGWEAVRRISTEHGIGSENLVKPGVGETTRVLLRRVPWKVLVRPDALGELAHVLLLAEQRGVPVEEVDDLAYSCVGLIHPRYTRGATGADGTGV